MKLYDDFMEAFRQAVQEYGNLNQFAEHTGIAYGTLHRWYNSKQIPSLQAIEPLLPYINWPPHLPKIKRLGEHSPVEAVNGDDLPTVPVHVSAGAGQPIDIWNAEPSRSIPVLPRYYQENIAAVEVLGDSMEPTIKKGAFVGVVPISGDLKEGDVYLVRRPPFGLLVKRVRMNENGEIILTSDNPAYPPQVVPFEGYEDIIIGHVVWCWQNM